MSGVDVDLHAARLALPSAGTRNRGSWSRPSAACRSPSSCPSSAWCRAGRCEPVHPRQIVGQRRLAEQRLGDAGAQLVGDGDDLVGRVQRAGADQHGDFLAAVQDVGGARAGRLDAGTMRGGRVADAGVDACRACAAGPRRPSSCRSLGKISAVTRALAMAMRMARSIRWRTCAGSWPAARRRRRRP